MTGVERTESVPQDTLPPASSKSRITAQPLLAVKTNALLWAGVVPGLKGTSFPIPNIGAEYYFRRRWSVNAEAAYTYHTYDSREQLRALSAYSAEIRYWLRADGSFRGFYGGVYGLAGDYDYQDNRTPDQDSYTNYTGKHWSTGLTVGFMYPVYRGLCVEVGLRGGFRHYYTNVYDREVSPYHNYYNYTTYTNKWGITGVYINVVYRFGQKHTNTWGQ